MVDPRGFLNHERRDRSYEKVEERVRHFREFVKPLPDDDVRVQAARCMDCGIPFCHNGCPVNNQIPDWNDLVHEGHWREALANLHSTNNFPEFTGRICPAPCEEACTLNLNFFDKPVTIKTIECAIVDKGWEEGWIRPEPPARKTGKRVAVVGSGPAGLAAAQQLARAGHAVTVFEREDRVGGLMRYGIPDFKMEKEQIDRRQRQMEAEGVTFRTSVNVGVDVSAKALIDEHDAVLLAGGAELPRDLPVPGRELEGVHFAMEFLPQQNRRVAGDTVPEDVSITAEGKSVVVIGGGDTGSDCIGTSNRQGARKVLQLELLDEPPVRENKPLIWPDWPRRLRISSSQEEGVETDYEVETTELVGDDEGRVRKLRGRRIRWEPDADGRMQKRVLPDGGFEIDADLVLLAMGFVGPVRAGMLEEIGVELDARGNVKADTNAYRTSIPKLFAAGDMRRGQSLVVWAIREGRQAARAIDEALMGTSELPR